MILQITLNSPLSLLYSRTSATFRSEHESSTRVDLVLFTIPTVLGLAF